ncbi:MAG: phosphosulfolactate synthase [Streptosporangiaceae bacterium]
MPRPAFLDLPERAVKPRQVGISHLLDPGLPLGQVADLLESAGNFVDVWKLGWGVAYLDPNLEAKLDLLARQRVLASPGGTLLEIAWTQNRCEQFLDWARAAGFPCVEVSSGTVEMSADAKHELIARAAQDFIVLAEVGVKDPAVRWGTSEWARAASADLAAGATWVIAEGRASGTVGIYSGSGEVREDVVAAMTEAVGADVLVFEAPRESQQAWFVRRFGPDVNLANVSPAGALSLETLRLSLRADTVGARAPRPAAARRA